MFLAISLVIGGLWLSLRAFLDRAGDLKAGYGFLESDIVRIFEVIGCGVLFVIMFWAFGYFAAVISTFIAALYAFGVRNWFGMLAGAITLAVVFQWLFMGIMLLNDPRGAILDLRPYTNWISGA